jgi:hypothetical protein
MKPTTSIKPPQNFIIVRNSVEGVSNHPKAHFKHEFIDELPLLTLERPDFSIKLGIKNMLQPSQDQENPAYYLLQFCA